ncbi:MAG: hypothetical protein RBR22_13125 [Desulfuromonas sp.]|nr:hypothetical protein [Desulfuromonas sp.]
MRVNFYAVTALPGTLQPDSFYYVANGSVAESYLTDSLGNAKSVGNTVMVNQLITAALAAWEGGGSGSMPIVADIAARDVLFAAATENVMALVIDASADPTVAAGSALYAYDFGTTTAYKVAEYESMDLVIQWASIQGKPASTVAQIDDAVGKAHQHANKTVLDKFTEVGGELLYGGEGIAISWATKDW